MTPLSLMQMDRWIQDEIGRPAASLTRAWHLPEAVEEGLVREAFAFVADRHDVLRTRLVLVDGWPHQRVAARPAWRCRVIEVSARDWSEYEATVSRLKARAERVPFARSGPFVRCLLMRSGSFGTVVLFTFHHLICDQQSLRIFTVEMSESLGWLLNGVPFRRDRPASQYGAFASRHNPLSPLDRRAHNAWTLHLAGAPFACELPLVVRSEDGQSWPVPRVSRPSVRTCLPPGLTPRLQAFAAQQNATIFMVLLAVLQILIHQCTGLVDVVVRSPVANRSDAERDTMGFFGSSTYVRTRLVPDEDVRSFLQQAGGAVIRALSLPSCPPSVRSWLAAQAWLGGGRARLAVALQAVYEPPQPPVAGRSRPTSYSEQLPEPLTQRPPGVDPHQLPDVPETSRESFVTGSRCGAEAMLSIQAYIGGDDVFFLSTGRFSPRTWAVLFDHYVTLLTAVIDDPGRAIRDLPASADPRLTRERGTVEGLGLPCDVAATETALRDVPGVADAVVALSNEAHGGARVLAFLDLGSRPATVRELRHCLRDRLPCCALPAEWYRVSGVDLSAVRQDPAGWRERAAAVGCLIPHGSGGPRSPAEQLVIDALAESMDADPTVMEPGDALSDWISGGMAPLLAALHLRGLRPGPERVHRARTIGDLASVVEEAVTASGQPEEARGGG